MNMEEKIKADAKKSREKLAKVKKWALRLGKVMDRKSDPISEAEFCRRHEINVYRFNRFKNGKEKSLPSDSFFNKVETSFNAENV